MSRNRYLVGIDKRNETYLEKVYEYIIMVIHGDVALTIRALKLDMAGWRIAREELEMFVLPDDELAR